MMTHTQFTSHFRSLSIQFTLRQTSCNVLVYVLRTVYEGKNNIFILLRLFRGGKLTEIESIDKLLDKNIPKKVSKDHSAFPCR